MADAYIGEIRLVPFGWAPEGWLPCEGQSLPIPRYAVLHHLIGTSYGSDDPAQSFKLPDLRGRVAVHAGPGLLGATYTLAQQGGTAARQVKASAPVTLTHDQLQPHAGAAGVAAPPTDGDPAGTASAEGAPQGHLATTGSGTVTVDFSVPAALPPYVAMYYIICVERGEYPVPR